MNPNAPHRVSEIFTTAIKGFAVRAVSSAQVGPAGLVGDREFFLVDDADQLFSVTRSGLFVTWWAAWKTDTGTLQVGRDDTPALSGSVELGRPLSAGFYGYRQVEGHIVEGEWAELFSGIAGRPLRLVKAAAPSGGIDVQPVSLVPRRSVEALGVESDGRPLDVRRFRLNVIIDGPPPFAEADWEGCVAEAGTAHLLLGGEIPRCAAVLHRPDDGSMDVNPLSMISRQRGIEAGPLGRGLHLGVYATVLQAGELRVGDAVHVGTTHADVRS